MTTPHLPHCPVSVLARGQGWLVADKPHGMSVHNAPGSDLRSILTQYLHDTPNAANVIDYDEAYGLHPVHRLDKETSGVILLSCRRDVFNHLTGQFALNKVTKRYTALVHGSVAAPSGWGQWDWPLTPRAAGRKNPQGSGRRSPCRTRYRIEAQSRHYSMLECRLLTGRTHQIRRHAALAGHPLVGDKRYGSLRACRFLDRNYGFHRLGLHAVGLTFTPPGSKQPQKIESAQLPTALMALFKGDS